METAYCWGSVTISRESSLVIPIHTRPPRTAPFPQSEDKDSSRNNVPCSDQRIRGYPVSHTMSAQGHDNMKPTATRILVGCFWIRGHQSESRLSAPRRLGHSMRMFNSLRHKECILPAVTVCYHAGAEDGFADSYLPERMNSHPADLPQREKKTPSDILSQPSPDTINGRSAFSILQSSFLFSI